MTEIDWEDRFRQQVADNIKSKNDLKDRLRQAHLDLDQANRRIRELEAEVKLMIPADRERKEAERRLAEHADRAGKHANEQHKIIRELRIKQQRGQRAVIEDVITWLHEQAAKMPAPEKPSGAQPGTGA